MTTDLLPEPSYAEAVMELVRCSHWTRTEVKAAPSDAAWQSAAWIQKCRRVVEAGDR